MKMHFSYVGLSPKSKDASMKMHSSYVGLHTVEHNIQPPMRQVVTIPVRVDDGEIVVYVSVSPFGNTAMSDSVLKKIAREIAVRLDGGTE